MDVEEISSEITRGLQIIFVSHMEEVLKTGIVETEKEEPMIIKSVNLETVCGITSVLPENTRPEIAFAGKSNVGSLL